MSSTSMIAATRRHGVALALNARTAGSRQAATTLAELFADPILDLMLRADHVERSEIELLLQGVAVARSARSANLKAC